MLLAVALPAIILAHLLGFVLLLYSLEKVSGVVSRTWKRVRGIPLDVEQRGGTHTGDGNALAASPMKAALAGVKSKGWVRGCACTDGCVCPTRWTPPAGARPAAGTAFRLTVPCPADLSWHGVTCHVLDTTTLKQKQVLHPCSGIAIPGETVALLGPSGAGKSTLLDVLAGRKTTGKLGGQVRMNGRPCGTLFKRISAYVAQEDVFVPTMTSWETLVFHATLTLPKAVSQDERKARMEDVLRVMGLWRARGTQVGGALPGGILVRGLSGGEKRRLSIACALIASPSILFLDEPTTGLDSFAALNVMDHMRDLAAMGHTVIASIHQPRAAIWDMFHKVCVLSEGYQLYCGRPDRALAWFSDALGYEYDLIRDGAVSDWMMDLVSVGFAKPDAAAGRSMTCSADVVAAYRAFQRERPPVTDAVGGGATGAKSIGAAAGAVVAVEAVVPTDATAGRLPLTHRPHMARVRSEALAEVTATSPKAVTDRLQWASGRYAASWWTQFKVLFKRAALAQLRNPTDATSRILLATWVGMLAGLAFFNLAPGPEAVEKRLALLFFTLLLFELLPFCYMSFYVEDRRFFAADVASDLYHPSAYYVATVIAGVPGVIINTLAGSLTAYGLAGLRADFGAIALNSAIVCVQSLISIQLQVFCVWLTPNQDLAYVLATGYVAASILLSGFYLRARDMSLAAMRGLSYLSYTKYAMEGVSQIELRGVTWDGCGGALGAAVKQMDSGLAGLGAALGTPGAAAPAPAAAAPAPGTFASLLSGAATKVAAAPAAAVAATASAADQLRAYLRDHPDAAAMYNANPTRAQKWLADHGYGAAVDELKAAGITGPIDVNALGSNSGGAVPAATPAAAAADTTTRPRGPRSRWSATPTAGDATDDAFKAALGGSLSDLQVASGGVFTGCDSTGDSVLAFWGYKLTTGQVLGILFVFYLAFHVGSYLALSKMYRQKR